MTPQKKSIVKKLNTESSLATFQDVEVLIQKMETEITGLPEVAEATAYFMRMLDAAKNIKVLNKKDYEDAGKIRKDISAQQKSLENETKVTPNGQNFSTVKKGLFTLHKEFKGIMDRRLSDSIEADVILKEKQNAWLNEQARIQEELRLKAEREAAELKREVERKAELLRLEEERKAELLRLEQQRKAAIEKAALQRRIDAAKKEDTKKRLEQEQVEAAKRLEQEQVEAAKRLEQEKIEAEERLEWEKSQIVIPIPAVMPGKISGVRKVQVTKVEVTSKAALVQWLLDKMLLGFLEVDTVSLAEHCKKQQLKDGEVPGIRITRSWDSQKGR